MIGRLRPCSTLFLLVTLLGAAGCEPTAFEKKIHQALKGKRDKKEVAENKGGKDPLSLRAALVSLKGKKSEAAKPEIKYNVVCPKDSKPAGKPPPLGREEWCERGEYINRVRHGPSITWHNENTRRTEAFYTDGKLFGTSKSYSAEGTLLEVKTYRNGEPDGRWIKWHNDGTKEFDGFVRGQIKLGRWTNYDRNGLKVSEGSFADGKKTGSWIEYYPSGRVKIRETYAAGKRDGKFVELSESGYPLEQGSFKDGKRSGAWNFYHATGQLKEQGSYDRGKKVGVWASLDVYGRTRSQRNHGGTVAQRASSDDTNGFKEL